MRTAVIALTRWMSYDVPAQDLRLRLNRIPAIPRSHVVLSDIQPPS